MNFTRAFYVRLVTALVVISAVVAVVTYSQRDSKSAIQFETARLERGRITARVTATGTLSALVTVQVGSQVSGRMMDILVDFNSPVHKGQVLARIDPRLLQAALEQARANLLAARGDLAAATAKAADADRQYARTQEMREQKLIAQSEVDTAEANAHAARAQVEAAAGRVAQAGAALEQNRVNLAYATISSPIDGVVISRNVDVGQTVAASLQAPTLFLIAQDLRKMQVDTSVAEADVGHLQAGMKATFAVDAYPGERFGGIIRQVRDAPQTVQNVVTYDAVIDVENPDLKLKPGMTANVTFVYAERDNTLRIPNAALRFRPSVELLANSPGARASNAPGHGTAGGADRTVWVLRAGRPEQVLIHGGVSDGTVTEALDGDLKEGDEVITEMTGTTRAGSPPQGTQSPFRRTF